MNITELKVERANTLAKARALHELSVSQNRNFTVEESETYNSHIRRVDELSQQVSREEDLQNRSNLIAAVSTTINEDPGRVQFRSFVRGDTRALQMDVNSAGGYLVTPTVVADEIIKNIQNRNFMFQISKVYTLTNGRSLRFPNVATEMEDSTWKTEVVAVDMDTGFTFGNRDFSPNMHAKGIKVSEQLINHSEFNAEEEVISELADSFSRTEESAFMTGDGSNKPLGIFVASANGIPTSRDISTGNTATAVTMDGLINAKFNLKQQYRSLPSCRWIMHRDLVLMTAKLKDANDGYYWVPSVRVNEPDLLLGIPVMESEYAPNTFTTGLYVAVLGAFQFHKIVQFKQIGIKRLNELYAATNEIGFHGYRYVDGSAARSEAFTRVKLA